MSAIGLIAGSGELPLHVGMEALQRGFSVISVAFKGFTNPQIEKSSSSVHWLKLGQVDKAIQALKGSGVQRVVMAGKIEKSNLLNLLRLRPDRRALRIIRSLGDWRDDTILGAIANELYKEGLVIEEITQWAPKLMAPVGRLTKKKPSTGQIKDIIFGRRMAQGIGGLDIGQTVVVKNTSVIAVEAIEGTDRVIRRSAELATGCVIVKMAKPNQDMRFDVPGIGPSTIHSMIDAKASLIAVEAFKTLLPNRDEMVELANSNGIVVVGIPPEGHITTDLFD
ncbi:MAG: LpxI family protein [Desulfomonilaceae bacterium]